PHEERSQISTRVLAPITTSSRSSPPYSRRCAGIVTRPCLSGTSSCALAKNTRLYARAALWVIGCSRNWPAILANSATGNTYRQRSCPLVITTPPARSSRNLAGRISRPLSSRRGVWVPRNIGPLPPRPSRIPPGPAEPARLHHRAPLYSTSLHRQRETMPV